MDNELISHLEKKYPDVRFTINRKEFFVELIYDNKKYLDDVSFKKNVLKECIKFLEEEDIYKLAIIYDFFNEKPEKDLYSYNFNVETFNEKEKNNYYKRDLKLRIRKSIHLDMESNFENMKFDVRNNWNKEVINYRKLNRACYTS